MIKYQNKRKITLMFQTRCFFDKMEKKVNFQNSTLIENFLLKINKARKQTEMTTYGGQPVARY